MKKNKEKYESYYDGPYVDSGLPFEERERRDREAQEECKKYKSWDDVSVSD